MPRWALIPLLGLVLLLDAIECRLSQEYAARQPALYNPGMRAPTEDGFYWFRRDGSETWLIVQANLQRGAWILAYAGTDAEFELSEAFKKTKTVGLVKGEFVGPLQPPS